MHNIRLIAHRGNGPTSHLSGNGGAVPAQLRPENTISAFEKADSQKADGIEFDLRLTADRVPVLIHDDNLDLHVEGADRTAHRYGNVSTSAYATIKRLNVGQGQPIPTLADAFAFFSHANARRAAAAQPPLTINIDLKDKSSDLLPIVQRHLRGNGASEPIRENWLTFCSSDYPQLALFKRALPEAHVTPVMKTVDLFGADKVTMPGWIVAADTAYRAAAFMKIDQFTRAVPSEAIDAIFSDIYAPMVKFAADRNLGICATACNVRRYDNEHLHTIIAISRLTRMFLKTDEPAGTRNSLVNMHEQTTAVLRGEHVIVKSREISDAATASFTAPEIVLSRRVRKEYRADLIQP